MYWLLALYALGCSVSQSLISALGAILAFLGILFFCQKLIRKETSSHERTLGALIMAWVLYELLNLWLRPFDGRTLHTTKNIPLILMLLLPTSMPQKTTKDWESVLGALFLGNVISLMFSIYQSSIGMPYPAAFFRNPIYFAYSQYPLALFWSYLWLKDSDLLSTKYRELIYGTGSFICLTSIAITNNRMTLLCLGLAGIFLIVKRFKLRATPIKFTLIVISFISLALGIVWSRPEFLRKIHLFLSGHDLSWQARLVVWQHNIDIFLANPLFGSGPEKNTINTAIQSQYQHLWPPGVIIFAHNIFLQPLADSGLIGFILFFSIWIYLWKIQYLPTYFVFFVGLAGLTENIFNNSKAFHSVYCVSIMLILMAMNNNLLVQRRER